MLFVDIMSYLLMGSFAVLKNALEMACSRWKHHRISSLKQKTWQFISSTPAGSRCLQLDKLVFYSCFLAVYFWLLLGHEGLRLN